MNSKKNNTIIIAEIGVNHNGSLKKAKQLALNAKIGADIVKFQLYDTELLVIKNAPMAEYQFKNLKKVQSQYQLLKKYEISFKEAQELIDFCIKRDIKITFSF